MKIDLDKLIIIASLICAALAVFFIVRGL